MALPQSRMSSLSGWTLWSLVTALIALATATILATATDYEGIRSALRLTARTSFILFMLAFTASSLRRLWPSKATTWLLFNRRFLGLAFAASHAIHLFVIVRYWDHGIAAFVNSQPYIGFIANVIGYIVIAAMAATSFDMTRKWLAPGAWAALHTFGSYFIWLDFAKSFVPRALVMPEYWGFVAVLIAGIVLRAAAYLKSRAAQSV